MLKSWKTRALAVAGAVALTAPFAFMSGASAVPGTPTITTVTPVNGAAGTSVTVSGTGCGTTAVPATLVEIFVVGPGITTPTATTGTATGGSAGDFSGTVLIPASARAGEVFSFVARCSDATGAGPNSSGGPTFTVAGTGLTGTLTGTLSGTTTGTTGVTGTGLTSTSGTTGTTTAGVIPPPTTGGAVPIPRQPNFTG